MSIHGHGPEHDPSGDQSAGAAHRHEHGHRAGLRGFVRSVFSPHSHDPADSVDQALSSSARGMRALWVSLGGLGATAAIQLGVLLVSGSVALLADTIHNFADALTALPLGIAFAVGRRAPTRRYTYGYGRAEDLAGVAVVAVIAASSVLAGFEAVRRLAHPQAVHDVGFVIAAGVVGFVGNEMVAAYRTRVGREIGSEALVADGLHARTDGFASLAVVVGAIGVAAGWKDADPIVGLVITVVILGIVRSAARDIFRRLMDSVDPSLVETVEQVLLRVEGVVAVGEVRLRWIGHGLHAEIAIESEGSASLTRAHEIAEEAHHLLLHELPRLDSALIHSNPAELDGTAHHQVTAHHFGSSDQVPPAPSLEPGSSK